MMMLGFGAFGLLFMLFFLVLIIAAAVAMISWLFPKPLSTPPANAHHNAPCRMPLDLNAQTAAHTQEETALDILKKRYARGEISKEEYESMKADILAF